MRQVLSQTSNLMVWSDLEVCANFTDIGGLEEASQDALKQQHELHTDPEPRAAAASLRTLVRLAHQVYREYQRQLFDPAVVKLGDAGVSCRGRDGGGIVCCRGCSSALAPLDLLALRRPPQSKELARQREALKKSYADVLKRAQAAEQRANQRREDALKCADQYDRTKAVHAAQDGTAHTQRAHL